MERKDTSDYSTDPFPDLCILFLDRDRMRYRRPNQGLEQVKLDRPKQVIERINFTSRLQDNMFICKNKIKEIEEKVYMIWRSKGKKKLNDYIFHIFFLNKYLANSNVQPSFRDREAWEREYAQGGCI